jgi:WD40 repeat protein
LLAPGFFKRISTAPSGRLLSAPRKGGGIFVWDVPTGKHRFEVREGRGVAAFSSDDKWLAIANQGWGVAGWNLSDSTQRFPKQIAKSRFKTDTYQALSIVITPDRKRILTGHTKGVLRAWNADSGEIIFEQQYAGGGHYDQQREKGLILSLSHGGKFLAAGISSRLFFLKPISGRIRPKTYLRGSGKLRLGVIYANGARVVSFYDRRIVCQDCNTRKAPLFVIFRPTDRNRKNFLRARQNNQTIWQIQLPAHDLQPRRFRLRGIAIDPSDTLLATGFDYDVLLINAQTGQKVKALRGHRSPVIDVSFAKGFLASLSADGEIRLWDVRTFLLAQHGRD